MRLGMLVWMALMVSVPVLADDVTEGDLIGVWDWERTSLGFLGWLTPEDAGYQEVLTFHADGLYEWHRDETLLRSGTWAVLDETLSCPTPQTLQMDTVYFGVRISDSTLEFGTGCLDGSEYYFARRVEVPTHNSTWGRLKLDAAGDD